eukprot:COSAG02_NODE_2007_length_10128_cov_5.313989_4_plen_123_part_00
MVVYFRAARARPGPARGARARGGAGGGVHAPRGGRPEDSCYNYAGRRTVVLSSTFENSFFDKNTVNTRNVTHYCVTVAEVLSTVSIYRVVVHFGCCTRRCPMHTSIYLFFRCSQLYRHWDPL